ncbi:hypothetical protein A6A04_21160 [Paramagnetospirillum marisnigri]|uniref:Uncharacterized protein n=1 Tax=Paramagnetospirillum marisnigri TaxID=1285242 RepID=A0A178M4W7_9PROT|nr:hypothetical protein [Paramagnetospirillum marisnigri]OAN43799.1 hypothetical protein A6A04_21160 [Paramagnetospirillum marisnigri]
MRIAPVNTVEHVGQLRRSDQLAKDLKEWLRRREQTVSWPVATKGSPFRGLQAFGEIHAEVFFGRRRVVKRALAWWC